MQAHSVPQDHDFEGLNESEDIVSSPQIKGGTLKVMWSDCLESPHVHQNHSVRPEGIGANTVKAYFSLVEQSTSRVSR